MVGLGRFFAGGFALAVQNVRTRILVDELNRPGLEILLDQYVVGLSTTTRTLVLLEIVHNGRTLSRETWIVTNFGHYLSLPWIRIPAMGQLEVFFTNTGATVGAACNLTGRHVHPGTFPLEN